MAIAEHTEQELALLPIENLLKHVAMLKHDYVIDAMIWSEHQDTERVDRKFVAYSRALRVLKQRPGFSGKSTLYIQDRIDECRPGPV